MLYFMNDSEVAQIIVRQYRASLAMLKYVVEACSEDLWLSTNYHNRFWHVAYHALYYAHLYVQASEADFKPWARHQPNAQSLGPRPGTASEPVVLPVPYSKVEVLEYYELCCQEVAAKVPAISFEAESGFSWLQFNRFEVHIYNLRHIEHHVGQLADRLRTALNVGTPWVRMG